MPQVLKPFALLSLAAGCATAQATPYAELAVCRPDYRAVIVAESATLVREVAAQLQAKLNSDCPGNGSALSPEAAQRLLADSLGGKYAALIDDRRLSVFLESAP